MFSRLGRPSRLPLLAAALVVLTASGCIHLPPAVKAEMEPAVLPANNHFSRDALAQPSATDAQP